MLGAWLDGSGWVNALIQGDIATPVTADSFIQVSQVTKTRHAHNYVFTTMIMSWNKMNRALGHLCAHIG